MSAFYYLDNARVEDVELLCLNLLDSIKLRRIFVSRRDNKQFGKASLLKGSFLEIWIQASKIHRDSYIFCML